MTASIRVAVVDDHPLFRAGVSKSLSELGFEIVAEGETAPQAIAIVKTHLPDVLLLDISLPGGGLNAIGPVLQECASVKILMLTASECGDDVRKALQMGASGYALKGIGSRDLAKALRSVMDGDAYLAPPLAAKMLTETDQVFTEIKVDLGLSERERQVLDLLAQGMNNKLIARKLDLHEKTVKHHATKIFGKLSVTNRTEAALKWRELGH